MFVSEQKVRFDDVDGAGIVYYPRFFHFCHKAFEDCFDTIGPSTYPNLVSVRKRGFPTVSAKSDFIAPLGYGDVAVISLRFARIGNSSLDTEYEIRRKKDEVLCFKAVVTTVYIDLNRYKSTPIDDDIRAFLEQVRGSKQERN